MNDQSFTTASYTPSADSIIIYPESNNAIAMAYGEAVAEAIKATRELDAALAAAQPRKFIKRSKSAFKRN